MSKVVLKSLFVIVALLTISAGTTNAYFSDSKVISGNVFSTGTWGEEPPEPKKVDICHLENKDKKKQARYHLINVSINALDAHLAHGDQMPGTMVDEVWFDEDCSRWLLIDTVGVPSDESTGADSFVEPIDGEEYLLKATGTYRFANWGEYGVADAEWAYRNDSYAEPVPPDGWTAGETSYPSVVGLDVQVDSTNVDWGDYSPNHEYFIEYLGTGNAVHFHIYDNVYSDNSGEIAVEIFEFVD